MIQTNQILQNNMGHSVLFTYLHTNGTVRVQSRKHAQVLAQETFNIQKSFPYRGASITIIMIPGGTQCNKATLTLYSPRVLPALFILSEVSYKKVYYW